MTISVCQPPSLLSLQYQVWPRDPAPPPTRTPAGTDAVETEPTLKAQEPTPQVQTQPSVSNMNGPWQILLNCSKRLVKNATALNVTLRYFKRSNVMEIH